MRVDPIDVVGLLVRDGVPEPLPGPDGKLRPPVPLGRRVELPGRGRTFVREVAGPPGAPTVLLVHGLGATGGLNWFRTFEMLGVEFRVLAPDLRGHGRGIRSGEAFRLADCADDLAALLDVLGTGRVLVAGYSMGAPVAQLLSQRHPDRVEGLVLCATAPRFSRGPLGARPVDVALGLFAAGARFGGHAASVPSASLRALRPPRPSRPRDFVQWTIAEFRRHDLRHLVEAARAANGFDGSTLLRDLDLPAAIVVTTRDRVVPPGEQFAAAALIEGASVFEVDGGHAVCARQRFAEPLRDACRDLAGRVARR